MDKEDKFQFFINILFVIVVIFDYIYNFNSINDPVTRHIANMIVFYGVMNYVNTAW